jgi:hypothetical protein
MASFSPNNAASQGLSLIFEPWSLEEGLIGQPMLFGRVHLKWIHKRSTPELEL